MTKEHKVTAPMAEIIELLKFVAAHPLARQFTVTEGEGQAVTVRIDG